MLVQALYDYPGDASTGVLELISGTLYNVSSNNPKEGWFQGGSINEKSDVTGFIAAQYVKEANFVILLRNYTGNPDEHQLQAEKGALFQELSSDGGWMYVKSLRNDSNCGYVPASYVKSLEKDHQTVISDFNGDASQKQITVKSGEKVYCIKMYAQGWSSVVSLATANLGFIPTSFHSKTEYDSEIEEQKEDEPIFEETQNRNNKEAKNSCKAVGCSESTTQGFCNDCFNFISFRKKVLNRPCNHDDIDTVSFHISRILF